VQRTKSIFLEQVVFPGFGCVTFPCPRLFGLVEPKKECLISNKYRRKQANNERPTMSNRGIQYCVQQQQEADKQQQVGLDRCAMPPLRNDDSNRERYRESQSCPYENGWWEEENNVRLFHADCSPRIGALADLS